MNGEADFKEFESRLKFETRLKFEFNVLRFIYTCSSNLCLFVYLITTHEPHDRFSSFSWETR